MADWEWVLKQPWESWFMRNFTFLAVSSLWWGYWYTDIVGYRLLTYHWRANAIRKRGSGPYDDRLGASKSCSHLSSSSTAWPVLMWILFLCTGPTVLCVSLFAAVVTNFILRVRQILALHPFLNEHWCNPVDSCTVHCIIPTSTLSHCSSPPSLAIRFHIFPLFSLLNRFSLFFSFSAVFPLLLH